jgi:hypothetical protein
MRCGSYALGEKRGVSAEIGGLILRPGGNGPTQLSPDMSRTSKIWTGLSLLHPRVRDRKGAASNPVAPTKIQRSHPSPALPRGDTRPNQSGQKNGAFNKFEERRVLCAFASIGECPVAVLRVRRSETNRPSKCLEDTRGELARKGLTHRRMSNDSPKIKWSCQRVNEQVGVGIPRQFSGRDGLLDQV